MEKDYARLGLKVGLEVHQQLETGKLFCSCPCVLNESSKPDFVLRRKLRATASELNQIDEAALIEAKKMKTFVYHGYNNSCCLVEADCEPPHELNRKALSTAFEIALMAKAEIYQELVPMRKIVIDGSNTSGFQRTMLVASNGFIEIDGKKIGVQSIVLEEDACRIIEKKENEVIYGLDRLGIPLIEFTTAPDIRSPEETKKVAREIGTIFRLTGKAKRGLGTIRQDLNISIENGARVELKGVQELEAMDKIVELEIQRQLGLIELRNEMISRGLSKKSFENQKIIDLTSVFASSECKFLKGKNAFGIKLQGMKGFIGKELQPKRRFGTELANYVKARTGLKGLMHCDELPNYGVSDKEVSKINELLSCGKNDGFALVGAEKLQAENALHEVLSRCITALDKVPGETRNVLPEGTSEYLRPIAGAARMYPETDLLPIEVDRKELQEISKNLALSEKERFELYTKNKKFMLSEKFANQMKLSNWARFFESMVLNKGFDATTTAALLLDELPAMKREGIETDSISNDAIEQLLQALKDKKITRNSIKEIIAFYAKNPLASINEAISSSGISAASEGEAKKIIAEIVKKNSALIKDKGGHAFSQLMGEAMKQLRGKLDGKKLSEMIRKEMGKVK